MTTMNEPLLPCPFCGSNELDNDGHRIKCEKCFAESPQMHSYPVPNPEYVLESWNRRTPPPASMKFPDKNNTTENWDKEFESDSPELNQMIGWNAAIEACKELNAPKASILDWFTTPNPLLGNVSPIDMIKNGRQDKVCKWILNQIEENAPKAEALACNGLKNCCREAIEEYKTIFFCDCDSQPSEKKESEINIINYINLIKNAIWSVPYVAEIHRNKIYSAIFDELIKAKKEGKDG